ncbi:putative protein phosphatase 2C [Toxoplasma gondii FOU]|uniref:Uncharacterized protein n=1 Tax=Toxoplasma gondii FOU TaxID=943167 RepID=A0A086L8R2_TOXGO|nr:putative protein phosphatase 2C [Toxoplasma gondii FOU]
MEIEGKAGKELEIGGPVVDVVDFRRMRDEFSFCRKLRRKSRSLRSSILRIRGGQVLFRRRSARFWVSRVATWAGSPTTFPSCSPQSSGRNDSVLRRTRRTELIFLSLPMWRRARRDPAVPKSGRGRGCKGSCGGAKPDGGAREVRYAARRRPKQTRRERQAIHEGNADAEMLS